MGRMNVGAGSFIASFPDLHTGFVACGTKSVGHYDVEGRKKVE